MVQILFSFCFLVGPSFAVQIRSDYFDSPQKEASPYSKALARFRVLDKASNSQKTSNNLTQPSSLRERILGALGPEVNVDDESIQATVYSQETRDGILRQYFYIRDSVLGDLQVLVLRPSAPNSSSPVVLGLHGHGGSGLGFSRRFLVKPLLNRGFVVVLPSFRAMEGRRARFNPGKISESGKLMFNSADRGVRNHEKHIARELLNLGHPLMGFRVREARLALKFGRELPLVDPENIFILAHSGGSAVAELLLRFEPRIRGVVLDYFSPYKRSWDHFCCEGIPKLAALAERIHKGSDLNTPVLKVEYNFPDPHRVLNFFKKHTHLSLQQSVVSSESIGFENLELQEQKIKTLFKNISSDGPLQGQDLNEIVSQILALLASPSSMERHQNLRAKLIFTLLSRSHKEQAKKVMSTLHIKNQKQLNPRTSESLLESLSLLTAYGLKSEARMLYQAFPPDLQIRAGQGLGDFAKSEPGASLSRQWKQAKRLKPTEARFLFESPLRKEVVFEHDLLITALKNPYERIEFLLEIALEHLPKGPLRERYLNHLPQTLEMLESPAHALEYLQMLINLLLPENSDPWFDLTLKKLREMEESDFRASKARPLLNLAIEYSRFSKAKKLLNFLETPEDQAKESQRINEEKAKALLKQGQKARIERELKSILKGLSTKANQPESLQIFLDLEEKAAKTGSNRLRKAILSQLFLAWQDFKPKASLPESFTLDFIERLLDIKLFRYAKECSKNLSKPARIEARILALAQRPRSQRPSFIHELLRTFQDLKPSEEKARFLTRTWQLTPSKTFLWMRKQFLKQAKACIEAMSPQDLKETGVNLIKTASEKGAYFEVNEMIGIKGKELENYRNYRIRRKERDNSFSFR